MEYYVNKNSIVREIWGTSDTILIVFAGASAEFATNKAVDWLYFTGKLPSDPLGRLFSTVNYAKAIVFSEKDAAIKAIDHITAIHSSVENKRGAKIPEWAYKDVLFMLIDYSIRSYELLERPLQTEEKQEVLNVFGNVGKRMGLKNLPLTYSDFEITRNKHLNQNLKNGEYTEDLYKQYRKHLGLFRYRMLLESQILLLPNTVRELLKLRQVSLLKPLISTYKVFRSLKIDWILKDIILPTAYKQDIKRLNITTS
ncbi:oxygenase MpaB family protein [uncultured Winogradskyella sp.]|uniref:oxygenase MpaB family protein n=1 Tax=uncultured Winogradskyella sp. TaxID=395353 RepID=UPI0030EEA882|tara:strand:- start:6054 stop:6818 length:765 start_codon:yes stop_codon:yes gene_type:complete